MLHSVIRQLSFSVLCILSGCESTQRATCDDVGRHVIDVMTASLGIPQTREWVENATIEASNCRQRAYSSATRECILGARTPHGIDRCLGR
jgi:hypothetical protein